MEDQPQRPGSFRFPPDLPITKIIPHYDTNEATVTFINNGLEETITRPFTWDTIDAFTDAIVLYIQTYTAS